VKRWIARLRGGGTDGAGFDAALTLLAVVVGVGSQFAAAESHDELYRTTGPIAVALGLAVTLPMFWRRVHPQLALLVSATAITVLSALDYRTNSLALAVLFLVYAAAAYQPLRRAVAALTYVFLAIFVIFATQPPDFDVRSLAFNLALFGAAWLGGIAMRSRSATALARLAEADERAEAHRQQAARAVAEERLRIAQELHDVVAHSMSVIAVQAGMGSHVIDEQPAQAKQALETISRTSRSTLVEMRRLLGVLRGEDGHRAAEPAPGLADLDALVDQVRAAGIPVDLEIDAPDAHVPPDIPKGIDLSAYRLVQEGLTNVIKHAGPATARVRVRYGDGEVEVEVTDDGRGGAASNGGGHGLTGMRERVAVWGGTLDVGPSDGGGYHVRAVLPYREPV
jgi:signal transduction histidine kinase